MQNKTRVFLFVFCASLLIQVFLWLNFEFIDEELWIPLAEKVAAGETIPRDYITYGYPGTSFLLPASLLMKSGIDTALALRLSLAILISIAVTFIGIAAHMLRPQSLWWVGSVGLIIFSRLYESATLPSSLVSVLTVLLAFLILLILERKDAAGIRHFLILGIAGGVALSTRFDITAIFLGSGLLFLWFCFGKKILITAGTSAVIFSLINLPMGTPLNYMIGAYEKLNDLYFHNLITTEPFTRILAMSPLAMLSVFLGTTLLIFWPRFFPVPKNFFIWLSATTLVITGILMLSRYHPAWYFYPLFFVWESLLPLFFLSYSEKTESPLKWPTTRRINAALIGFLVFSQAVTTLHLLSL